MNSHRTNPDAKLLSKGRDYLSDPDNWIKGRSRKLSGWFFNRKARYCATGWISFHADPKIKFSTVAPIGFLTEAAWQLYGMTPVEVNDQIGHSAVLRMYDLAIELALDKPLPKLAPPGRLVAKDFAAYGKKVELELV
jgi:hypothetical protein